MTASGTVDGTSFISEGQRPPARETSLLSSTSTKRDFKFTHLYSPSQSFLPQKQHKESPFQTATDCEKNFSEEDPRVLRKLPEAQTVGNGAEVQTLPFGLWEHRGSIMDQHFSNLRTNDRTRRLQPPGSWNDTEWATPSSSQGYRNKGHTGFLA